MDNEIEYLNTMRVYNAQYVNIFENIHILLYPKIVDWFKNKNSGLVPKSENEKKII